MQVESASANKLSTKVGLVSILIPLSLLSSDCLPDSCVDVAAAPIACGWHSFTFTITNGWNPLWPAIDSQPEMRNESWPCTANSPLFGPFSFFLFGQFVSFHSHSQGQTWVELCTMRILNQPQEQCKFIGFVLPSPTSANRLFPIPKWVK